MLSLFRKSAPPSNNAAIVELIYAGRDMAAHLVMQDGRDYSCVCGMIAGPVENPSHHRNFCPVARFYAAVESVRMPAQDQAEADREFGRKCAEDVRRYGAAPNALMADFGYDAAGRWHDPNEYNAVERDLTDSRPATSREDAAVIGILAAVTAVLIWAIVHFAQKAGLPW
jgi:hypothetical protein